MLTIPKEAPVATDTKSTNNHGTDTSKTGSAKSPLSTRGGSKG